MTINLAMLSMGLGLAMAAGRLPGLLWPERFRSFALAFPRSVGWGRLLMGVAALIAGVVVFVTAQQAAQEERLLPMPSSLLGGLIHLVFLNGPVITIVGIPLAYVLVIFYGQNFLSLRAVAALMLLLARVVVAATDRSEVPARLVLTTLAYLWVITAIWMAIAPHHFRDLIQYLMANNRRCRLACGGGFLLGLGLVLLGLFVY